jgi:hypothetical protein
LKASDYYVSVYGGDNHDSRSKLNDREELIYNLSKFIEKHPDTQKAGELIDGVKSERLRMSLIDRCLDEGTLSDRKYLEQAVLFAKLSHAYTFDDITLLEHVIKVAKSKGFYDIANNAYSVANSNLDKLSIKNERYLDSPRNSVFKSEVVNIPRARINTAYGDYKTAADLYKKAAWLLSENDVGLAKSAYLSAAKNYSLAGLKEQADSCYSSAASLDAVKEIRTSHAYKVDIHYDKYS